MTEYSTEQYYLREKIWIAGAALRITLAPDLQNHHRVVLQPARYSDLTAFGGGRTSHSPEPEVSLYLSVLSGGLFRQSSMAFVVGRLLQKQILRPFSSRQMSLSTAPLVLSPAQLHDLIQSKTKVSVLDTTWFMPNSPRKARDEFAVKRIPGAQFLDLDEVASPNELGLKHMMPEGRAFADACGKPPTLPHNNCTVNAHMHTQKGLA